MRRLRHAGAVILGKTNLSEFAFFTTTNAPSGYSSLGGQVLNACDADLNPSGSSSGSATAAAAGLAALTIGTEPSGSIISPSAQQGIVGMRPTVGLPRARASCRSPPRKTRPDRWPAPSPTRRPSCR